MTPGQYSSATWRRSSRSSEQGDQCVEVANLGRVIGIRDSKCPGGSPLVVDRSEFRGLIDRIKAGRHIS